MGVPRGNHTFRRWTMRKNATQYWARVIINKDGDYILEEGLPKDINDALDENEADEDDDMEEEAAEESAEEKAAAEAAAAEQAAAEQAAAEEAAEEEAAEELGRGRRRAKKRSPDDADVAAAVPPAKSTKAKAKQPKK